jgi:hypothetical protein
MTSETTRQQADVTFQDDLEQNTLLDKCDGCGAENALYNPRRLHHECPKCGALYDVGDNAKTHLQSLLVPILEVWAAHYKVRGVGQLEMVEIVHDLAEQTIEEVWQG